jgi:hypothetical protein
MENVTIDNIVFLTVTSFKGTSIGATHWYGRLRTCSGEEQCDVLHTLSKVEAKILSKKRGMSEDTGYSSGEKVEGFDTREAVIRTAKRQYKKHFPLATVLIIGRCSVADPQRVLLGPKNFKRAINKIVDEFEELGGWENEDEEAVKVVWNKWQKIWPLKYT